MPPRKRRWLSTPSILVATIGLILSGVTFFAIRRGEEREIRLMVEDEFRNVSAEFLEGLDRNSELLFPVRHLFTSLRAEEPYAFQKIVNAVTARRPNLRAILWFIPNVPPASANELDSVSRRIPSGRLMIGGVTFDYFKDYFVGPEGSTGPTVYFDANRQDALLAAFQKAQAEGISFDSAAILPLEQEGGLGYSILLPIAMKRADNAQSGFLVGNYEAGLTLQRPSRYSVMIHSVTSQGVDLVSCQGLPPSVPLLKQAYGIEKEISYSRLGARFRIRIVPSRELISEFRTKLPLGVLFLGLLLTLLLSWHLHSKERKERMIQSLFDDLVSSNVALQVEIEGREKAEAEHLALERRMFKIQKMEAMARLAGGVAHDTNNYLGAISGQGELASIKWGDAIPELRARMDSITETCRRATQLMKQLMAFGRGNSDQQGFTEIDTAIRKSLDLLAPLLPNKLALHLHLSLGHHRVQLDPSGFEQVLMNLVINARDAISGNGTITLETRPVSIDQGFQQAFPSVLPGRYALIGVSDTGSGIASEVMDHIFEPFYTTKEPGKGTGLGLSTVYGIVTRAGGSIEVDSQMGRGTTFEILLPLAPETESE